MAGFPEFFGSRKRGRAVAPGLAPGGEALGSHPSSELVIYARRAGEIAPTPQPIFTARARRGYREEKRTSDSPPRPERGHPPAG
jgi:hypothetical protein